MRIHLRFFFDFFFDEIVGSACLSGLAVWLIHLCFFEPTHLLLLGAERQKVVA